MAMTYREACIQAVQDVLESRLQENPSRSFSMWRDRRTDVTPEDCDQDGAVINIAPGDQTTTDSEVIGEDVHVLEIRVESHMAPPLQDEPTDPESARVPSDLENAQLSRDLSLLHAEIFEALTDPNAEPWCPEWIEDVRVTDSQFDLMTVEQSDRPFGRVVLLVQVSYRTPRGMAFLPAD